MVTLLCFIIQYFKFKVYLNRFKRSYLPVSFCAGDGYLYYSYGRTVLHGNHVDPIGSH